MVKKAIKIYLEESDAKKLKAKAKLLFGDIRGSINRYIEKISREPIVFLDSNAKVLLKALNIN